MNNDYKIIAFNIVVHLLGAPCPISLTQSQYKNKNKNKNLEVKKKAEAQNVAKNSTVASQFLANQSTW
jgi:hypothetical protein